MNKIRLELETKEINVTIEVDEEYNVNLKQGDDVILLTENAWSHLKGRVDTARVIMEATIDDQYAEGLRIEDEDE